MDFKIYVQLKNHRNEYEILQQVFVLAKLISVCPVI